MSALLKLRDYQTRAIEAIHTKWDAGVRRPATVLPTGAGKTVVFSHLAESFLQANPGKRVLVLSHTEELGDQAADKMRKVAPHRTVGVVRAGRNETHAEVISASVQTLRTAKRREQIRNVGLIIVDECHHAVAATYRAILEHYHAFTPMCGECWEASNEVSEDLGKRAWPSYCPNVDCVTNATTNGPVYVAGFTATLVRGDKEKLSDVWEDVAFRLSIAFMIRAGYLLDVKGKRVEVPDLDLRSVKQSGGDYQEGALGDALVEAFAPEIVAKAYAEHASDRKGVVFAPTVDSAYAFAKAFVAEGITCEVVHGALPKEERRGILARLKSGQTQVVANCMVLTEGWDEPTVSCGVIARPTKSAGLYQQMVGRVLRPDLTLRPEERGHALVMDVVGVSRQHDLRSLVDLSTRDDLPEELDEDLSLLALEDLIIEEPQEEKVSFAPEETWYAGPAEAVEFDPLGRDSEQAWARTPDGTYYLSAGGSGYLFLADSIEGPPGTFDVVWCASKVERGQQYPAAQLTEHRGLDFPMATAWAEEEALERGATKTLIGKKSRWRKEPATVTQIWRVRRIPGYGGSKIRTAHTYDDEGVEVREARTYTLESTGEPVTKGMAAEIIDAHNAASVIDPLVKFVRNRQTQSEG